MIKTTLLIFTAFTISSSLYAQGNDSLAEVNYNKGIVDFHKGDFQSALSDFTQVIKLNPKDADALNNRASCKTLLKDYQGAIQDYTQSIAIAKSAYTYNNLGSAQRKAGNNDDAIASYSLAISLKPDYFQAYNNRGTAKLNKGDYIGAISDFDKAIELNSSYSFAYNNKATAEYKLQKYDNAKADCDKAIALNPKYGTAYLNRGIAEEVLRNNPDACNDWNKAASLGIVEASGYAKDCK